MNICINNDLSPAALTSSWEQPENIKISSPFVLDGKDGRKQPNHIEFEVLFEMF